MKCVYSAVRTGSLNAEDFYAEKIRRLRPGLNPRTWVPEFSMLTTRPPKPLVAGFCRHGNDHAGALTTLATVTYTEETFLCGFSQMLGIVRCEDNDTLVVR
jgi:hypothetical protein